MTTEGSFEIKAYPVMLWELWALLLTGIVGAGVVATALAVDTVEDGVLLIYVGLLFLLCGCLFIVRIVKRTTFDD